MTSSIAEANKAHCGALLNQTRYSALGRSGCRPNFDSSLCWEETGLDTIARQSCPFKFCSDCALAEEERFATRHCRADGAWSDPNYAQCVFIFFNTSCIEKPCRPCSDPFRQVLMNVTLILSIVSVVMLVTSISLFACLKAIHCRRLTIHGNLALAFVLRFTTYIIWILLQRDQVFQECSGALKRETSDWLCKIILSIIMYSTLTSTFWMFVEGAYLVSRFSVYAMRATDGPLYWYLLVGWAAPVIFVLVWVAAVELQDTVQFCWMPFTTTWTLWLLVAPMSAAFILNVLFLVVVIVVIIQKMRSARSTESTKIWQTIKATLLLMPLLGVSNLLLFYEPARKETLAFRLYLLTTAVLQHSQGIFVAVLYCFGNGEVQRALKREIEKLCLPKRLSRKESSGRRLTACSSSVDACIVRDIEYGTKENERTMINREFTSGPSRYFLIRAIGKSNAIFNGSGHKDVEKMKKHESAVIRSKNCPNYQSCLVRDQLPMVIVTSPDGNFKYL